MGVQASVAVSEPQQSERQFHSASLLYTAHKLQALRDKALEQIVKQFVWREDDTLLVRAGEASANGQYSASWGRDMIRVLLGLQALPKDFSSPCIDFKSHEKLFLSEVIDSLWRGLFGILQKYESVMDEVIKQPTAYSNEFCISPRVDPETLGRIEGKWSNTQEPQWLGELLIYSAPWLVSLSRRRDPEVQKYSCLYQKAAQYLVAIGCFEKPFANGWEEEPKIYTTNLAASLGGLEAARKRRVPGLSEAIGKGRRKLEERLLPLRETDNRDVDLAQLWIRRYDVVTDSTMDRIVPQAIAALGTVNGVPRVMGLTRYFGDWYQGLDGTSDKNRHPSTAENGEWFMGLLELAGYFATKPGAAEEYAKWLGKAISIFETYDKAYEQFVPIFANGAQAYNPQNIVFIPRNPLTWPAGGVLEVLK
ncbi:hypothetical protein HYU16_04560 [Candidatus Woesearchaeota archaeon]|nr:hypothetical protein [Candidatus Woesearchaeota archaeon]